MEKERGSTMNESLFEQLGGEEGVGNLVDDFYVRILADAELAPFFENANREGLIRMQKEFFSSALGGPALYSGRPLSEVHAGRGIEKRHLARFVEHLLQTLKETDLDENAVNAIYSRVALHADELTGEGAEDG